MTGVEQLKNRCKHWFETTSDREIYSLTIILSLIRVCGGGIKCCVANSYVSNPGSNQGCPNIFSLILFT